MKKKTIVAALLMAGFAAGVGTQIHAQDTAYVCGGNHSGMHHTAHECIRTLQEQQAAKAAAEKRQAAASASYAKTAAQTDTFGEDCNNSRQGYHHGGEGGQGMHHGNGHHGR